MDVDQEDKGTMTISTNDAAVLRRMLHHQLIVHAEVCQVLMKDILMRDCCCFQSYKSGSNWHYLYSRENFPSKSIKELWIP